MVLNTAANTELRVWLIHQHIAAPRLNIRKVARSGRGPACHMPAWTAASSIPHFQHTKVDVHGVEVWGFGGFLTEAPEFLDETITYSIHPS